MIIGDHIAGIDAYAKPYPAIAAAAGARIIRAQPFLYLEPAGNGIGRAVEFDEKPVPHGADQAAAMLGDLGLDQILCVIGDRNMCSRLVDAHQPAIADDIGKQDGLQSAFQLWLLHARPTDLVCVKLNGIFLACHARRPRLKPTEHFLEQGV